MTSADHPAADHVIRGQLLAPPPPLRQGGADGPYHWQTGAVAIANGKIVAFGQADDILRAYPGVPVHDHGSGLILPGFVDAHVHYPQTAIIASWGKRLIDWLNTYTFPEEARFHDPAYAAEIADRYLDLVLAHGTTTMCSYGTIHPASVDAFFTAAQARGMRVLAGKTCMDRNAPDTLRDTAQSAYDDSKALLQKWHGSDRLEYVITPRFAPTSSPEQLSAMGALWAEHPTCLMQTHLSEQVEEIAWVKELYPTARDYLDIYETFGLFGERAVYGHAIHMEPRERAALAERQATLVHCPTSNTFIGSGLFDTSFLDLCPVGLGSDTGGGSSFSMLRTMAAAYEIAQLQGNTLHPSDLIWWATTGSAQALKIDDKVGRIAPGMEADLIILDLASTPAIAQATSRAEDIWQAIFPTIMMGDDRAISQVYIAGAPVRPA